MRNGTLFLIVGPSGAGKDTLLDGARLALEGGGGFVFPRRVITRPADAGGEVHEPETAAGFARRREAGAFALSWHAHGLDYGVPAAIAEDLAGGRHVVVNVSRAVIGAAAGQFSPLRIILITASAEVLARRLAARGRETAADIAERLARAEAPLLDGVAAAVLVNDGTVEDGVRTLISLLTETS